MCNCMKGSHRIAREMKGQFSLALSVGTCKWVLAPTNWPLCEEEWPLQLWHVQFYLLQFHQVLQQENVTILQEANAIKYSQDSG